MFRGAKGNRSRASMMSWSELDAGVYRKVGFDGELLMS